VRGAGGCVGWCVGVGVVAVVMRGWEERGWRRRWWWWRGVAGWCAASVICLCVDLWAGARLEASEVSRGAALKEGQTAMQGASRATTVFATALLFAFLPSSSSCPHPPALAAVYWLQVPQAHGCPHGALWRPPL
jgi:hypothetical protein